MKTRIKAIVLFMTALVMTMMFGVMVSAAVQVPVKVTGLVQTDASETAIYYTWNDVNSDYRYHVETSTNGVNFTEVADWSINDVLLTGLQPGTSYYMRIRASVSEYDENFERHEIYGPYSDVVEMITAPSAVTNFVQTGATINSYNVAWTAVPGATYYKVYKYANGVNTLAGTTAAPSGAFTNVNIVDFGVKVAAVKKSSSGYEVEGNDAVLYQHNIKLLPKKVTGLKYSSHFESSKKLTVQYDYDFASDYDGYEIQVFKGTSKKVWKTVESTYGYADISGVSSKYTYRIKARAYVVVNGQKLYGEWSKEMTTALPKLKVKANSKSSFTLSWNKIKNAKSYTVYMSDKANKGFKKVSTIKKTSIKITKFKKKAIKKNKKYYVKLVVNVKSGKKTVKVSAPVYYVKIY